jgi:hypothetical protein
MVGVVLVIIFEYIYIYIYCMGPSHSRPKLEMRRRSMHSTKRVYRLVSFVSFLLSFGRPSCVIHMVVCSMCGCTLSSTQHVCCFSWWQPLFPTTARVLVAIVGTNGITWLTHRQQELGSHPAGSSSREYYCHQWHDPLLRPLLRLNGMNVPGGVRRNLFETTGMQKSRA